MKLARMAGGVTMLGLSLLSACGAVGPDYRRPAVEVPAAYKERAGWKLIAPQDAENRGPWWSVYHDPVLDDLEEQIDISNQNLKAAEAAFRQARAAVEAARASFFPILSVTGAAQRSSGGRTGSTLGTNPNSGGAAVQNNYNLALGASWEPDIWGKIRRTVEGSVANAQASAADLANARLSAQATLATDYFELRVEDELKHLLDETVAAYTKTLQITQNRYVAGVAAKADVISAETQLKTAQAQSINVGVLRAQLEHAIAVLIGRPPAEFSIAPKPLTVAVPAIPASLPSTLLERNPAVAAAERAVAASNARIGVALSAYYPDITLSASYGFAGTALGTLLQASNSFWSLGPLITETLFDAGARHAQVAEAQAAYDQSVAQYRQTVLTAFQQVEDQLAALRILEQQSGVQNEAVQLAKLAVQLTINEYKAGTVPYTSVVTAQVTALANEQAALTVRENQLIASIALIEALGGGWDVSQLPAGGQMHADYGTDAPPR